MAGYPSSEVRRGRVGAAGRFACVLALALGILAKGQAQTSAAPGLTEAIRSFEAALIARDLEAAMGSWDFETETERAEEEAALTQAFAARELTITSGPPALSNGGEVATILSTIALISEPLGVVEQWGFMWERTVEGWRIVDRRDFGGIDGLVHLDMQTRGFVADGQTIELEDFTLQMLEGTFFLNSEDAGPTSLVFEGRGRVRFKPRPRTERGQMKIFAKSEVLDDEVSRAFLRLHPADLYRTLKPGSFADDPKSEDRLDKAREFFEEHKGDAFVLDAAVTGAPWWLLPGLGDAAIIFETRRYGLLTLSLNSFDKEGVSLFSRKTRRQIVVYPREGAQEEDRRADSAIDLIHHDLKLSLDPDTFEITGQDTMTIEVGAPLASFRMRLDDDLKVRSIRSVQGGSHLFFRVRDQNSILVSMGSLAGRVGSLQLTVNYSGRLPTGTVDSELLQFGMNFQDDDASFVEPALIYSTRRAFHPVVGTDDYATSTLTVTVPEAWTVVAGGVKTESTDGATRTVTYDQTTRAKYLAFMAARLRPVASESANGFAFNAYAHARAQGDAADLVGLLKSGVRFYEGLFGPLPYSPLNVAVVESPVPGGHSPPGLLILQLRPLRMGWNLRDDPATFYDIPGFFLAHELAHQWWGHGITPETYRDRWVSEGFAQYGAALWTRESRGENDFRSVLRKMVSWARRLTDIGPVDLGTRVGHIQNNGQAHRAVVYDKGALVLDMVRRLIGDEAFGRGLARMQREYRFGKVDSEMVRHAFETEGSIDLDALWEAFVRTTPLPTMRLVQRADGPEIVVDGYAGPLPLEVEVDGERLDVIVSGRLKIPGARRGARVSLDPEGINLVRERR